MTGAHRRLGATAGQLIFVGLGLVALIGCNRPSEYNPVAPSALITSEPAVTAGGAERYYTATMAQPSVAAGSATSLTITLTNCDGATCFGNTSGNGQQIGAAQIVVPAGFTATAVTSVTATGGKSWNATLVNGTIQLGAVAGNHRLAAGESVTVAFNAIAASQCTTYSWQTQAYQGLTPNGAQYALVGAQPYVDVTGCTSGSTGCTLSVNDWKNDTASWPVQSLMLGSVPYSAAQLLSILNQSAGTNGLAQLAQQLIAAKLNVANGADGSLIVGTVMGADALIGALVVPPVGSGWLATSATDDFTLTFSDYNNGFFGPGSCQP